MLLADSKEVVTSVIFDQVFVIIHTDRGPLMVDHYSPSQQEPIDIVALKIMSAMGIGLGLVAMEQMTGKMFGPTPYPRGEDYPESPTSPPDGGGSYVWYGWRLENPYSSDSRTVEYGEFVAVAIAFPVENLSSVWKYMDKLNPIMQEIKGRYQKIEDFLKVLQFDNYQMLLDADIDKRIKGAVASPILKDINELHFNETTSPKFPKTATFTMEEKIEKVVQRKAEQEPDLVFMTIADETGRSIVTVDRGKKVDPSWVEESTLMKIDAFDAIADALTTDQRMYGEGTTNEEMMALDREETVGKSDRSIEPGIILIDVAGMSRRQMGNIKHSGIAKFAIKGQGNRTNEFYLLAGCNKRMSKGEFQAFIMTRTVREIITSSRRDV